MSAAKAGAPINAMAAITIASLFTIHHSVELIVQPDAKDVVGEMGVRGDGASKIGNDTKWG
jgi:hypothetical protein